MSGRYWVGLAVFASVAVGAEAGFVPAALPTLRAGCLDDGRGKREVRIGSDFKRGGGLQAFGVLSRANRSARGKGPTLSVL